MQHCSNLTQNIGDAALAARSQWKPNCAQERNKEEKTKRKRKQQQTVQGDTEIKINKGMKIDSGSSEAQKMKRPLRRRQDSVLAKDELLVPGQCSAACVRVRLRYVYRAHKFTAMLVPVAQPTLSHYEHPTRDVQDPTTVQRRQTRVVRAMIGWHR